MPAEILRSTDPRTGVATGAFPASLPKEAVVAVEAAASAAVAAGLSNLERRRTGLRGLATALEEGKSEVILRCGKETGLPDQRLEGELMRTVRQLETFSDLIGDGELFGAIIDTADPEAQPIPRPDLRRVLMPLGPVAVFGASNFPLAFGVLGGDTASALAAGCPVVAKGHPSHPATNRYVARLAEEAIADAGLAEGAFALVQGADLRVAEALVDAPELAAVAFTGSNVAGRALFDRAAARPRPIPVFAEMGSVNPLIVTPAAAAARGAEIATGLAAAISGSGGQMCTKPGLILVPSDSSGEALAERLGAELEQTPSTALLNERIYDAFLNETAELSSATAVRRLTERSNASAPDEEEGFFVVPSVFTTAAASLADDPQLLNEHFGPVAVVATYRGTDELLGAVEHLDGQLTASVHAERSEEDLTANLVSLLTPRVGRLIFDGYPTGVSVSWAQQHGGPYPATTAPGTTSVGLTAAARFLRPVAFQAAPAALLPPALRDENPLGIVRRVNGVLTRDSVGSVD